jgi:excinuclease ABC subunit C
MKTLRMLLDVITKGYKLRTCSYMLNEKNVEKRKYRLCVEFQIGNCAGPCEGLEKEEDYKEKIDEIRKIIKGDTQQLVGALRERMMKLASEQEFERAHEIKLRMELIDKYRAKSTVVNSKIHNVDVFSIVSDAYAGYVNFMKINNGAVIQSHTMEIRKRMEESDAEILAVAIADIRQKFSSQSYEIYLSKNIDIEIPGVELSIPKIGDKKKLINLSLKNANYYMLDRYKDLEKVDPDRYTNRILDQVRSDLRLSIQPDHMECFDNSNMQGTDPVAACIVFKNGKPSKKDYRHFNIKTVKGPDDFASMEEVVYRRYSRMLREGQSLPQVVVIDGGKGQLSAAMKSIKRLGIEKELTVLGIAKRLEEIYYPGDQVPIYLDKRSSTLRLIQNMRNEAHRFGITHHRGKRAKRSIRSELSNIQGIGPKTTEVLLKKFGSVKQVKSASQKALTQAIGASKAATVRKYFDQQKG